MPHARSHDSQGSKLGYLISASLLDVLLSTGSLVSLNTYGGRKFGDCVAKILVTSSPHPVIIPQSQVNGLKILVHALDSRGREREYSQNTEVSAKAIPSLLEYGCFGTVLLSGKGNVEHRQLCGGVNVTYDLRCNAPARASATYHTSTLEFGRTSSSIAIGRVSKIIGITIIPPLGSTAV
jgi:hypothetical protein